MYRHQAIRELLKLRLFEFFFSCTIYFLVHNVVRRGSYTSYKNDIRMIEMDVVDLIFGRLGVYLRHVLLHGVLGHVAVLVGSP